MTFATLASEKHKLVHVATYGTIEPPRPRKKGIFYMHFSCGKKIPRSLTRGLPARSRRFPTCVRCCAFPKYPSNVY